MPWLALIGAGLVVLPLVVYVAYSQSLIARPGLAAGLAPLLGWPRRIVLIGGVLLAMVGVMRSSDGLSLLAGLVAALAMRHALRRQWAFGLRSDVARPRSDDIDEDVLLAVLPDGRAAPVAWLESARLVHVEGVLLVACSMARSLAAFEARAGPPLVLRPLAVGFAIGAARAWDGTTGVSLDGHADLVQVDLARIPAARWRAAFPDGVLLGPARGRLPTVLAERVVRLPGAKAGAPGATDVGVVVDGSWSLETAARPRRYLARWAATISGASFPGS